MADSEQKARKVVKSRRGGLLVVAGLMASHACAGYIGDSIDFRKDYVTPTTDWVRGIERADGFIGASDADLVSIVNSDHQREVYLNVRVSDDLVQVVPVNEDGYAVPDGLMERMRLYFQRNAERFEDSNVYERVERVSDKAKLMFDYYKIKFKEAWDNIF